jgi:hypothetical protein
MTDNVKLDVYNDVETALNEITALKNTLKYNSQDVNNDKISQKQYPQAWISLASIDWNPSMLTAHNQDATQEQKGNLIITIHIEQYSLSGNETTWKPDLALINTVYRKLANMSGKNYTPLQRVSEIDDVNNDNVRDWQMSFTTSVTECGVSKELEDAAPVELTIVKVINN